jgi:two-component system, chemotaxis family, response regulator Rcp1
VRSEEAPQRIFQILLIEDSPSDVRLFKEVLREWRVRYCLSSVEDGIEALEFLSRSGNYAGAPRPDLIVLDLNMPVFRKNSIRASRSDFLKPVFMMKSAEDGGASNRISGRNTMPMSALLRKRT